MNHPSCARQTDVNIESLTNDSPPTTLKELEALSAKESAVAVNYRGERLFSLTVPKTIYSPLGSKGAKQLIDLIMKEEIKVAGKRVVDLGCGSGIIGLCTALKESRSVLFTDINPAIRAIAQHPLFRVSDRVTVEDLCENEEASSVDLVMMSIPGTVRAEPMDTPRSHHLSNGKFHQASG